MNKIAFFPLLIECRWNIVYCIASCWKVYASERSACKPAETTGRKDLMKYVNKVYLVSQTSVDEFGLQMQHTLAEASPLSTPEQRNVC